jgi:arylsulfatase A-like enzyme
MHWPKGIPMAQSCDQTVGIFDFFATFAEMIGHKLSANSGEDSCSYLPAFKGLEIDEGQRDVLIHHSIHGAFAVRKGQWKLCRCPGSGGWSHPRDEEVFQLNSPHVQLYHMGTDPVEKNNLSHQHPEVVDELTQLLHKCIVKGHSKSGIGLEPETTTSFDQWKQINWLPEIPETFVLDD